MTVEITLEVAQRVLEVIDAGLSKGLGDRIPGQMCVEAAVCYALGLPHGDEPDCVDTALRGLKIRLNDGPWSSNMARAKGLRRLGLAQLDSLSHLDTKEFTNRVVLYAVNTTLPRTLRAASANLSEPYKGRLETAAAACSIAVGLLAAENATKTALNVLDIFIQNNGGEYPSGVFSAHSAALRSLDALETLNIAYAASSGPAGQFVEASCYAAHAVVDSVSLADDAELAFFAEGIVQILIEMKAPGVQWLTLAPLE
jgi:hypothetical protein